jgi:hypothetical protein
MTTIATYGAVSIEERDTGFAVCVTRNGTTTRVGPLYERKHEALRAALAMAEVTE